MTAAKVKTQILHCDHLMNKIIGWRIDGLVDFEYVARWEVRFNRIATQIVEYYTQEKCREQREELRRAVADYMRSEGCSCCRNIDSHEEHEKRLAELLDIPMYDDDSGYDFNQFVITKTDK